MDIKTRQLTHDIKVFDKSVDVVRRMKNAYVRTKDEAEKIHRTDSDSPTDYAEHEVFGSTQNLIYSAGQSGRHLIHRISQKPQMGDKWDISNTVKQKSLSSVKNSQTNHLRRSMSRMRHVLNKEASKITKKTSQTTARGTKKTVQTAAKSTQKAAQVARVVSKTAAITAKTTIKAVIATVKAVAIAVKGIAALLAAGGGIAVVIVILIAAVTVILCSSFGVFVSDEGYGDNSSMPEIVAQINSEFEEAIDSIIATTPHNTLIINNPGTAGMVANWSDVLAVYAVKATSDPVDPVEVATLNADKINILQSIFWDMVSISYTIDIIEHKGGAIDTAGSTEAADGGNNSGTEETILTITISYKAYTDMIDEYNFNTEQTDQLTELMKPEYQELFKSLTVMTSD